MIKRLLLASATVVVACSGCAATSRSFATMASIVPGEAVGTHLVTVRVEEIQADGSRRTIAAPQLVVNEGSPSELTKASSDQADVVMIRAFVPSAGAGVQTQINVTVKENFRIVGQTDVSVTTR